MRWVQVVENFVCAASWQGAKQTLPRINQQHACILQTIGSRPDRARQLPAMRQKGGRSKRDRKHKDVQSLKYKHGESALEAMPDAELARCCFSQKSA